MREHLPNTGAGQDRKRFADFPAPGLTAAEFERVAGRLAARPWQAAGKRALDFVVALALLIVLSFPFFVAAVAVKLSSPGPVLFRQEREGLGGRRFSMLKFRSMRTGKASRLNAHQTAVAAQGILVKMAEDPRVTPVGRWLRMTSVDELPQLFNVLRGEMSLVGPRPLMPFMLQMDAEFRRVRALVRPGMTGLWQVRDRINNTTAAAMKPHDLDYIENISLTQDIVILLRTIPVVLTCRGAV